MIQTIVIAILLGALGAGAAFAARAWARRTLARVRDRARALLQDAESKAQIRLKEAELEAEELKTAAEAQFETQTRKKRQEVQQLEDRLKEQERNLQRRLQLLGQKQREVDEGEGRLKQRDEALAEREREAQALVLERRARLEKIASLTTVQARRELLHDIEAEARQEASRLVRKIEEEAREEGVVRARRVVAEAIQRLPSGAIVDNVVTVVQLPNDEMKGRIIGREGRNIRAIEMATGVDLIVDETPQAIVLSSFDPFRRAVAAAAIGKLVEDGRIHPARVEEVVSRCRIEMDEGLENAGEAAAFELGITGLPARLTRLLGRLKYRIVLGYNLLDHSIAVARLGQQMATLLGAQAEIVKRAGLLHDVGQVEEGDAVAAHPTQAGADLLARLGEDPRIVLKVAERAVIARPGERDDNLTVFIERLEGLESIAASFSGVSKAYAMRSGKELRVIVEASAASDSDVLWITKDITTRIQREIDYPGSIRVSVIRETRAVDYAT